MYIYYHKPCRYWLQLIKQITTSIVLVRYWPILFCNFFFLFVQFILVKHLQTKTLFHFSELACNYCKQQLPKSSENLLDHCKLCTSMHRPSSLYYFSCFNCDYHSNKGESMRRHLMRYTGERPYKCDYCEYCAIQKSHLKKHVHTQHRSQVSSYFTKD